MDFLKWLSKKGTEKPESKVENRQEKETILGKIFEEVQEERGKFVCPETGRTYKTEAALKGARTRRKRK